MRRLACALILALTGPALPVLTTPAWAHHSLTGYDSSRSMTLDGVVTEFSFTQPHPFLTIKTGGAAGQSWKLEMDNLYELDEIGISKSTFKPGDRVLVRADPSRTRSGDAYMRQLDRPSDGLRYEQVGYSPRVNQRPK
jgi:hypothetical protein